MQVGFNDDGKLISCQIHFVSDSWHIPTTGILGCYSCPNWKVDSQVVTTDTALNTDLKTSGTLCNIQIVA